MPNNAKRILSAITEENKVVIEMDYTYLSSLKMAIYKSFKWGYNTNVDDYYDVMDIWEELQMIEESADTFGLRIPK